MLKLTVLLDLLLKIVVALGLLGSGAARSEPTEEASRVDTVQLGTLLLIPSHHDEAATEGAHMGNLGVGLADVSETLSDHVGGHLVTVLVLVLGCLVTCTLDLERGGGGGG